MTKKFYKCITCDNPTQYKEYLRCKECEDKYIRELEEACAYDEYYAEDPD